MSKRAGQSPALNSPTHAVVALGFGLWLGLALLKFGNPVVLDQLITPPAGLAELIFSPWPVRWGYVLTVLLALASLTVWRKRALQWPLLLLGAWIFWQFVSGTRSVDAKLTEATLAHFSFVLLAFGLGHFAFVHLPQPARRFFWIPVLACYFFVLFWGFEQRNGGLEAMRRAFYEQPDWQSASPEFIRKINSNRIFSTLVYPNALAGAIMLFAPVLLYVQWMLTAKWPRIVRGVALGLMGYLSAACFYWTESKGGWLIALFMLGVVALHTPISRKLKIALIVGGGVVGLAFFAWRFSGYFERGATSVGARFDYWNAAVQTFRERPVFGSGPGTFQVAYKKIKPPDAEMARLTHNDYLEQASDSGAVGFVTYTGFVIAALLMTYRRTVSIEDKLVWLGVLGWAVQCTIEFGLYIPALAWPAFFFIGYLLAGSESRGSESIPLGGGAKAA